MKATSTLRATQRDGDRGRVMKTTKRGPDGVFTPTVEGPCGTSTSTYTDLGPGVTRVSTFLFTLLSSPLNDR